MLLKKKNGLITVLSVSMLLIALAVILNTRATSMVQAATDDGKFYPGVYSDAEKEMLARVQNQGGTFGSAPQVSTDAYGVYHLMEEGHFGDSGTAGRMPIYYMAFGRNHMVRMVTNYIGDDGWLRKFEWRNETSAKEYLDQVPELKGKSLNAHGTVGSVLIAQAFCGTGKFLLWTYSGTRGPFHNRRKEDFPSLRNGGMFVSIRMTSSPSRRIAR